MFCIHSNNERPLMCAYSVLGLNTDSQSSQSVGGCCPLACQSEITQHVAVLPTNKEKLMFRTIYSKAVYVRSKNDPKYNLKTSKIHFPHQLRT